MTTGFDGLAGVGEALPGRYLFGGLITARVESR
jgi:hypothetical protein